MMNSWPEKVMTFLPSSRSSIRLERYADPAGNGRLTIYTQTEDDCSGRPCSQSPAQLSRRQMLRRVSRIVKFRSAVLTEIHNLRLYTVE